MMTGKFLSLDMLRRAVFSRERNVHFVEHFTFICAKMWNPYSTAAAAVVALNVSTASKWVLLVFVLSLKSVSKVD